MLDPVSNTHTRRAPVVLAVDDDRTMRMMLVSMLEELGYEVVEAVNGKDALAIIEQRTEDIDAVLLDREMPVMGGTEVIRRMKENRACRNMPVIMQTGSNRPEQIKEGIDLGVFYYLTKPVDAGILKSVLSAAIRESNQNRLLSRELAKHKSSFNLIESCRFKLKTLSEAEHIASFLANCFPDVERVVGGLAELLINAVEHGNLGVTYNEKTALVADGSWREEVDRRSQLEENRNKQVSLVYERRADGHYVKIKDEGPGFDWKSFLYIDPARASDNHGRGIAQANAVSFDKLTYNAAGNEALAFVGRENVLNW